MAILVEELVTNLYDHGGLAIDRHVGIELARDGADVILVLTDPGEPFNPDSITSKQTIPARGGGAGLKLLRAWATSVDYHRSDGLNRLEVRFGVSFRKTGRR